MVTNSGNLRLTGKWCTLHRPRVQKDNSCTEERQRLDAHLLVKVTPVASGLVLCQIHAVRKLSLQKLLTQIAEQSNAMVLPPPKSDMVNVCGSRLSIFASAASNVVDFACVETVHLSTRPYIDQHPAIHVNGGALSIKEMTLLCQHE